MSASHISSNRIPITKRLAIPVDEIGFRFSRAGGPGGQHVNTSETRVELLFDVARSRALNDWQRSRIMDKLSGYIDSSGVMHLFASRERSQRRNRELVLERFRVLLADALRPSTKRQPTRPPAAAHERRLREKARRSQIKRIRGQTDLE